MKKNAKVNTKANEVKTSLNISILKSYIDSIRKSDETLNNIWGECKGDEKLEPLGRYLEGEAMKLIEDKPKVGVVPVYLEDSTMRNWIIDFLSEGNTEENTVSAKTPTDASTPAKETKSEPVVEKPKAEAKPTEKVATKPVDVPKSKPVPSIKKANAKIYLAMAEKEGCAVLVRAYDDDTAMKIAKSKAKEELGRQRLKMVLTCVSEGNAKPIAMSCVSVVPATSEADSRCFLYTDKFEKYGIVFAADWKSAEAKLTGTIVDEYDEFTNESWAEIEDGMVFKA